MERQMCVILVLAGALCGACTGGGQSTEAADVVVWNAKVLTVDPEFSTAEAVTIRDGVFSLVGTNEDAKALIGAETLVIDAHGRTAVPGLFQTHSHATGAARGEARQEFVQLHSIDEIQDWVRARAAGRPEGTWIELPRVDVTRIDEGRIPTPADLDTAAPNHPAVYTWRYGGLTNIQVLNAAAVKAAELTKETRAPEGGQIHRHPDGTPTGVIENASALLDDVLPERDVTRVTYLDSLATLMHRYNEVGITSLSERSSGPDGYRDYQLLRSEGRLPVRVTVTMRINTDGTIEGTERVINNLGLKYGEGDEWVKVGPLKVGVDGGSMYGTSLMREPYPESSFELYRIDKDKKGYRGSFRTGMDAEKLKTIVQTGHRLGWQMSSHVTGDLGVDYVLDAVEAADESIRDRRYTLIHAYYPNPETAERVARLGVAVDTQPAWLHKDGDALLKALGKDRMNWFIGLKVWQDAGVKVSLNADHMQGFGPVTSLNPYHPFLAMYVAVTRKTDSGQVINRAQGVSREDALRMHAIDSAWLSFDEDRLGSIEVGKLADLVILSDDYLTCEEERIKDIKSVLTIVGGEVVYEDAAAALSAARVVGVP